MTFYEKITVSGYDHAHTSSNEFYVSLFQCVLCTSLVSHDSVVSDCCSQPFCGACHAESVRDLSSNNQQFRCPKCHDRLEVKQLQYAQPLAFKVLSSIQIACQHDLCSWKGRYDQFLEHVRVHGSVQSNSTSQFEHSQGREFDIHDENVEERTSGFQSLFDKSDGYEKTSIVSERERLYKKADKLKKLANAKSNTGNMLKARKMYTQGIDMLKDVPPKSDSDFKLLSDMHANRAFTFFQKKNFKECINDCESAIEYEPSLEKSWMRKWRALMAKGDFDEAHQFLRHATLEIPESSRIQQAYSQSKAEMETCEKMKSFVDDYSMADAEQAVREYSGSTENIFLLTLLANFMIAHGYSKSALKIVERALEVNPHYVDCLELRGLCHFYSGDFEQGVHALSEACKIVNGNKRLESAMAKVHATSKTYEKGRLALKRCSYEEANVLLREAIDLCAPVPSKSAIFSMLTTEHAKCLLGMMEYYAALQLCDDIIEVQSENVPAWIVRSEVLMALGKTEAARQELHNIRCTWGTNDLAIQLAYRRVDFELSVMKVNMDVLELQENLDKGIMNAAFKVFSEKEKFEIKSEGKSIEDPRITRSEDKRSRRSELATERDSTDSDLLEEPIVISKLEHRGPSGPTINAGRSTSIRRLMKSN